MINKKLNVTFCAVLKVHHPGTVHARPAFNDAPPETNDESDGKVLNSGVNKLEQLKN